ncbi:histone deacetylase family protein [Anaeromyxobacter oryzae]|uniref:Acetoin utilization protein n=1 Tax=Anaeromyxobacter oryzae TaxID=2918170 RepID=A0ABM7WRP4_9BACT|nr:histone deacetylase [Anaeromyxobacter oryzae]BDG02121.1 acetoin utilization protein [Anaeromyxobacter oryzae]
MSPRLLLVTHPDCLGHDTGHDHPESVARLAAIEDALARDPDLRGEGIRREEAPPASLEDLLRVHTPALVDRLRALSDAAAESGVHTFVEPETPVSGASFRAAVAAAGCAILAAERVARGEARAAFALARPPGHHAAADRAGGYCLLNNVAIAARSLQAHGLARRILVVDWDVHHGDGTQAIFWEDPTVHLLSLHLFPHYPHTGAEDERGAGSGLGATRNVPVPPGTAAVEYRRRFAEALDATLREARPDVVLVSAGFDLLAGDPQGGLALEPADLHALTTVLLSRAAAAGCTRVAAVLEGGYVPARVAAGVLAVARALAGLPVA